MIEKICTELSINEYVKNLKLVSLLSGLFSDSSTPYINYRVVENIFCNSLGADNLSRSDTAFDAKIDDIGFGIKTFRFDSVSKNEKIAEFNKLSNELKDLNNIELAYRISEFRNERIFTSMQTYGVKKSYYHCIARSNGKLTIFDTEYEPININHIKNVVQTKSSLKFNDDKSSYNYNFSKSTLFKEFQIPKLSLSVDVEIAKDPILLLTLISNYLFEIESTTNLQVEGVDYVILPLFSTKKGENFVPEKSSLNQWNAGGRKRNESEIYIPIQANIHRQYPEFFPKRDLHFELVTPLKETLKAKVCQENSKALMTNPNKALANWLLRTVLRLQDGELCTMSTFEKVGVNAVRITKLSQDKYSIDIQNIEI